MKQLISTFLLGVSAFAPILTASDVSVCPNSPYPTIQSGVNAASPGSHIRVCAARYAEQVTVPASKNNLSLEAQGLVILTAPISSTPSSYGFRILAPGVQISGFNITGFNGTFSAGIIVTSVSNVQIRSNLIYGNCSGILLNQSNDSTIKQNNVSQNPYPAFVVPQKGIPPSPPTGTCQFADSMNIALDGYGIRSKAGREVTIDNNDVEQNGQTGTQLLDDLGGSQVSNNKFFANDTGPNGSALGNIDVRCDTNCIRPMAESIQIAQNTVDRGTTGIYLTAVNNISVSQNTVTDTIIGINVMDSNRNTIDHNTLDHNSGANDTGMFVTGIGNEIAHNDFNSNDAGIFVFSDACPGTYGNVFSHNKFENNPQFDITDATEPSLAGCNEPPPANYTPGTFDFYDHNKCSTSTPPNLCSAK